jgi:hypothetical protein
MQTLRQDLRYGARRRLIRWSLFDLSDGEL